jgi:uncharacterized protein
MSLSVTPTLVEAAGNDTLDEAEFVKCVAASLPYAYRLVAQLAEALPAAKAAGRDFTDNQLPPPDQASQGQLLRAMASTSIRSALERRFGVVLAFQNCHRLAAFAPETAGSEQHQAFTSARAQVLNQQPEFVDC